MPVKNTVYFSNFGALKNESGSGMEQTNNCGSTIYWNGTTGSCGSLTLKDVEGWRTISKTVDFELAQGNSITREVFLKGQSSESSTKNFESSTIEDLKYLHFDIRDKYWYSAIGDAYWNVGGEKTYNQPFEYYFDNVLVEEVSNVNDNNMKVTENFEKYNEGECNHILSYFKFSVANGDKIEVAKNPKTNSKALKITKSDKSTSTTKAVWNSGKINDKVVKVSYDVIFENHSRLLRGFPALSAGPQWIFYRNSIYWDASMTADTAFNYGVTDYQDVQHVEITHDSKKTTDNVTAVITRADGSVKKGTYTKGVGNPFETVTFNTEYAADGTTYQSHMGTSTGDGIYWIDNISVEIVALNLESSNIKNGDTAVPANKNLVLNFNEAVSDSIKQGIFITKGTEELTYGTDYTVTLSEDAKTVTVKPLSGEWDYETTYEVVIPTVNGAEDITPYNGTIISFVTGKYSSVLINDNFSYLTLGNKWSVASSETTGKTVTIGDNVKVLLQPGDSVEYAYDAEKQKNGLKLTKGSGIGNLDFKYIFPENYTDGKYRVVVDERIAHHSKGHTRWPAMLDGDGAESLHFAMYGAGYWLGGTGAYNGKDRFEVDWSTKANSRWINDYGENNQVAAEFISGTGLRYGTYNPTSGAYNWSVEPATTVTALGGVLMRMRWTGSSSADYANKYVPGSAEATEDNQNNDGIAWIYSVKAEEIRLNVEKTSFEDTQLNFSPKGVLTVTFNEALDSSSVNANTFRLYKGEDLIDNYEYNVSLSADGKTVTLSPVAGLEYGTAYTIKISKEVMPKDSAIKGMREEKNYTLKTEAYVDTVNPDIVWSSLPNGSENVEYGEKSIVLATNNVLLDKATVTKDNIKVYENGVATDKYSLALEIIMPLKLHLII